MWLAWGICPSQLTRSQKVIILRFVLSGTSRPQRGGNPVPLSDLGGRRDSPSRRWSDTESATCSCRACWRTNTQQWDSTAKTSFLPSTWRREETAPAPSAMRSKEILIIQTVKARWISDSREQCGPLASTKRNKEAGYAARPRPQEPITWAIKLEEISANGQFFLKEKCSTNWAKSTLISIISHTTIRRHLPDSPKYHSASAKRSI